MTHYDIEPWPETSADLGVLISTWQDGTREWREYLESPCEDAIVWQIYPNGPSIGGVLLHMAACEAYWLQIFVDGEDLGDENVAWNYDRTVKQDIPFWTPPPSQPIDWYFSVLDDTRRAMIERIRRHADSVSVHARSDYTVTYRWILAHLVEHDSYHGGQVVLIHEAWKAKQSRD